MSTLQSKEVSANSMEAHKISCQVSFEQWLPPAERYQRLCIPGTQTWLFEAIVEIFEHRHPLTSFWHAAVDLLISPKDFDRLMRQCNPQVFQVLLHLEHGMSSGRYLGGFMETSQTRQLTQLAISGVSHLAIRPYVPPEFPPDPDDEGVEYVEMTEAAFEQEFGCKPPRTVIRRDENGEVQLGWETPKDGQSDLRQDVDPKA